ncbi:ABC transporter G family member 21-like [Chenopodium quinoa]|uniref:ABC transporter G family member 21-like n=1 Tax=Chenopodium quinoa TaxID=63459 RepID=UPI000B788895|nr:ABC transporter G family member 21-like [Chenopodium quinoa]
MMPIEQDPTSNTGSPTINNHHHAANWNISEDFSVHIEPSASNRAVSPCLEDLESFNHQQSSVPSHFSTLHGSLRPITLKFQDVTYNIPLPPAKDSPYCLGPSDLKLTRVILNGVTGIVRPGELLAMLGPSGSGKTTLLTALGGRLPGKISSGSITYNGHPYSGSIKRKIGFVTQDDVLYPHLTVAETLMYTALLRLHNKLTKQDKIDQVEMVINELGLTRCRNTMIGGALFRGVSGGERKRVSIGQEMLVNPSLLLLDEPTSGLDSTTAQRIMDTLKSLARGGRTVLTTIHQPSSRLYQMFDKVVVLSEGCPIYYGSASRVMDYFCSIGLMPGCNFVNPADFLLDLANGIVPDTRHDDQLEHHNRLEHHDNASATKQFLTSAYKKNIYPGLKAVNKQRSGDHSHSNLKPSYKSSEEKEWSTTWLEQFKILLERGLKERRHESYSGLRIFQVLSVSIISGLLWWHSDITHIQDQVGLLFFFSIFWGFFPLFNAIFAFPQERPMLSRERASGMYNLSAYYLARMVGDLPMELVLPSIFVSITYYMGGLKPSPFTFLLTLLVVLYNVLVSQGLGLALGALLMDVKQATTLASVTMLVFLLAGGYYIQHIPPFIAWLKYISFSHYCYKLLVGVQYSGYEVYECGLEVRCKVADFPTIKQLGIHNLWFDVVALTMMLVGYRLLAYAALRMNLSH